MSPGGEIESVGFESGDLEAIMKEYDVENLKDGYNVVNGKKVFYISNPALGHWGWKENFK